MNRTEELLYLLQYSEKQIDKVITDLGHVQSRNVNIKVAVKKLYELSNEFNCRINHLKREL